jgi:hypothetical protein
MFPTFVPGAFKDCAHQSPFLSDSLLHVGLPASLVLTVLRLLLATTLPLTVNPITCDTWWGREGGREGGERERGREEREREGEK